MIDFCDDDIYGRCDYSGTIKPYKQVEYRVLRFAEKIMRQVPESIKQTRKLSHLRKPFRSFRVATLIAGLDFVKNEQRRPMRGSARVRASRGHLWQHHSRSGMLSMASIIASSMARWAVASSSV